MRHEPLPNSIKAPFAGRQPRDLGRVLLEDAELGAGRIVFRQLGDPLEQDRARGVIEILRGQRLGLGLEAGEDVGCERRRYVVRFGKSGKSRESSHCGTYAS